MSTLLLVFCLSSYWFEGKWSEVPQSCPTLWNPMDCSLPSSSIHGIFQARILEWVAISFSRRSSLPRDWIQVSCMVGRCFTIWATREVMIYIFMKLVLYHLNILSNPVDFLFRTVMVFFGTHKIQDNCCSSPMSLQRPSFSSFLRDGSRNTDMHELNAFIDSPSPPSGLFISTYAKSYCPK